MPWAFESFAWKNALIPDAQYFQPLQCYTLDHLDLFLNEIRGVHFDGVSMPVRTLKPAELALFLVSFYQRGITRVHLLGTSSFPVIVICAYAAWNLFEWVSLDSTTWRFAADKESFISPFDLSRTDLRTSVHVPATALNLCPCPFCRGRSFPIHPGDNPAERQAPVAPGTQLAGDSESGQRSICQRRYDP